MMHQLLTKYTRINFCVAKSGLFYACSQKNLQSSSTLSWSTIYLFVYLFLSLWFYFLSCWALWAVRQLWISESKSSSATCYTLKLVWRKTERRNNMWAILRQRGPEFEREERYKCRWETKEEEAQTDSQSTSYSFNLLHCELFYCHVQAAQHK